MTNWPDASAVASATVVPASRSSTLAFGSARPAMTASPVGSTFTTSKAGFNGEAAASPVASPPGAEALAAGVAVWTAGAAGGTVGALGSGARATTWVAAGLGQRNPGWVHSSAPATAPATTTVDAAAPPTQTSVFCDSMLARLRAGLYRESDDGDKCLSPFLHARGLHVRGEFRLRLGDARFLRRSVAADGGLGPVSALGHPGQRIERKIGALGPQPEVAERAFGDAGRQLEAIDQVGRGEDAAVAKMAERTYVSPAGGSKLSAIRTR
jgi:hypothetical protein